MTHKVLIALGSNLGDRLANIKEALRLIKECKDVEVVKESSIFETPPWRGGDPGDEGVEEQGDFYNSAAELSTTLPARELLEFLLSVEVELGRVRGKKWGPRVIDLDIILFDDDVIDEKGLKVPHPFAHVRDFVVVPASEIMPKAVHPLLKKTLKELADAVTGKIRKVS